MSDPIDHLLTAKTVVGRGDAAFVVEARSGSIRLKPRHGPEIFIPYEVALQLARAIEAYGASSRLVRP